MRIPRGRRWMFYALLLGGVFFSVMLSRGVGLLGLIPWVLIMGCLWAVQGRDQARVRVPRREDGRVQSRFGKVTGQTRTAVSASLALARLATFLDHDERFRLDHVEEAGLRATRRGNTFTDSYPLAFTVRAADGGSPGGSADGAEVEIVSDPSSSVVNQEEDTVRVIEDLLDVIDRPVGNVQEAVGHDPDGASMRTPRMEKPGTRTPETQTPEDGEDRSHE